MTPFTHVIKAPNRGGGQTSKEQLTLFIIVAVACLIMILLLVSVVWWYCRQHQQRDHQNYNGGLGPRGSLSFGKNEALPLTPQSDNILQRQIVIANQYTDHQYPNRYGFKY